MNRITSIVAGLSLAFVGTTSSFAATTWYVSTNGLDSNPGTQTEPYATIAHAIDVTTTVNGDTVLIEAGTYYESLLNPSGKAITIQGSLNGNGSLATTIDAQQGGSVFTLINAETNATVIKNLVVTGGSGLLDKDRNFFVGGGIVCYDSDPTIVNCNITGNTAEQLGGGIYCFDSSPIISGCTIADNTANENGGGIICDTNSSPTISGCTITGNTAGSGGGIFCENSNSNPTITDCTIADNMATYSGGGIFCFDSNPTINGGTVCGNTPTQIDGTYTAGQPEPVIAPTCPPATGACCLGGTCITATESDCAAAGGTYGSDYMACADANCATTTPGDVNADGTVDTSDLDELRTSLDLCASDTDMDGDTDIEDLLNVVAGWGTTCP